MSNQGSTQLNACKTELKNIIVGLEDIENHVRADYKNIGNIQCADSIRSVINKYQSALNTLNSVDASVLDRLKEAAEGSKSSSPCSSSEGGSSPCGCATGKFCKNSE